MDHQVQNLDEVEMSCLLNEAENLLLRKSKEDMKKGVELFRSLAERGSLDALCRLGEIYFEGIGVKKNYKKSVAYFRQAAHMGHPFGTYKFGFCILNGSGITRNDKEAVLWYQKALMHDVALAKNDMGFCLEEGRGTPQNKPLAVVYYTMAMNQGIPQATYNLARCYQHGSGVPINPRRGFELHLKAVQMGNRPLALRNLAQCYDEGKGTDVDEKKAFDCYVEAAKQGDPQSLEIVYSRLQSGKGAKKDLEEAYQWLKLGLKFGIDFAAKTINSDAMIVFKHRVISEEWPDTHILLNRRCRRAVVEIFCCLTFPENSNFWTDMPSELSPLIIKQLILVWSDSHLKYKQGKGASGGEVKLAGNRNRNRDRDRDKDEEEEQIIEEDDDT